MVFISHIKGSSSTLVLFAYIDWILISFLKNAFVTLFISDSDEKTSPLADKYQDKPLSASAASQKTPH